MLDLLKPVQYVKGVGPAKVQLLNKLGIFTLEDLITYFPREHEDRSKITNISDAVDGQEILIEAIVVSRMTSIKINGRKDYAKVNCKG